MLREDGTATSPPLDGSNRHICVEPEGPEEIVDCDAPDPESALLYSSRETFYKMVKHEYWKMIEQSLLPPNTAVSITLLESIDSANSNLDMPIGDFYQIVKVMQYGHNMPYPWMASLYRILMDVLQGTGFGWRLLPVRRDMAVFDLYGVICCMDAHMLAESALANLNLYGDIELWKAHQAVISESEVQNVAIRRFLKENNITDELVNRSRAKQLALCLLSLEEKKVHKVFTAGLICEADAEELLESQKEDYHQISRVRDHWRSEPYSDNKFVKSDFKDRKASTRAASGTMRLDVYNKGKDGSTKDGSTKDGSTK